MNDAMIDDELEKAAREILARHPPEQEENPEDRKLLERVKKILDRRDGKGNPAPKEDPQE